MSSLLLHYVKDLKTSKPIFKVRLLKENSRIEVGDVVSEHKYTPSPIDGDPLSELVSLSYTESWDSKNKTFTVDKSYIAEYAFRLLKERLIFFLERNLAIKNPRQSKIYRWLYYLDSHNLYIDKGLVLIYKYMVSESDSDFKIKNTEHAINIFALLNALRKTHEEKS